MNCNAKHSEKFVSKMDTFAPQIPREGFWPAPPSAETSDQRPFKSQKEEKDVQRKISGDLPSSSVKIVA